MRNSTFSLTNMSSLVTSDAGVFYSLRDNFPAFDMILVDRQSKRAMFVQKTMSTLVQHLHREGTKFYDMRLFTDMKYEEKGDGNFGLLKPKTQPKPEDLDSKPEKLSLGGHILDLLFREKGHKVTFYDPNQDDQEKDKGSQEKGEAAANKKNPTKNVGKEKEETAAADKKNPKLIIKDPQGNTMSGVQFVYAIGHEEDVTGPPIENVYFIPKAELCRKLGIIF